MAEATSLTSNIKTFLKSDTELSKPSIATPLDVDSVYDVAGMYNITVNDYIQQYPKEAKIVAERNLAKWSKILGDAILTGYVMYEGTSTRLTKNHTDLFKIRVAQAEKELEEVSKIIRTIPLEGQSKGDQLISSAFDVAVNGNVTAIKYLVDRVDGKIGEPVKDAAETYDLQIYKILHSLFDKQLQVIHNGTGAVIARCSRRAGKTHLAVAAALISCLSKPYTRCVYISETAKKAEMLFSEAFNEIVQKNDLTDTKGNRLNWRRLDNGSSVMIRGMSTLEDPDVIRGFKAEVIILDEFFHMKSLLLEYLIREVLQPMQMDFRKTYKTPGLSARVWKKARKRNPAAPRGSSQRFPWS
jgi:hypothetical protein